MAESFNSVVSNNIGPTPTTLYSPTATSVLVGCNLANLTVFTVPVDIWIERSSQVIHIVSGLRLKPEDNTDIVKGKIVVLNGDVIKASADVNASVDLVLSFLSGVN